MGQEIRFVLPEELIDLLMRLCTRIGRCDRDSILTAPLMPRRNSEIHFQYQKGLW